MKNIILILLISVTSFTYAQIYPLDTSPGDVPDNAYIKDTNNELDKYVGMWKGNWNGKIVFLELRKIKYHYIGAHSYYIDKILGERKIINSNGLVEIDRIVNFDIQNPEFRGVFQSLSNSNWKQLLFFPKNMCNVYGTLDITNFEATVDANTNQSTTKMTMHFRYEPNTYDLNCIHNAYVDQHNDFPINFPKDIVLTKQ
ncbi:DUF6705 family protein [Chryseobacterium sp. 2R14A]|uniref:DUF6705 family protein n=1 Tax=Chryseobacterium sp. 2R14A TaxID=3380353 RepID=UPI003CF042C7